MAPMTKSQRRVMKFYTQQDGICFICGTRMPLPGSECLREKAPNRHHVIPVGRGGPDNNTNRVATHTDCNSRHGDTLPSANDLERLAMIKGRQPVIQLVRQHRRQMATILSFIVTADDWIKAHG